MGALPPTAGRRADAVLLELGWLRQSIRIRLSDGAHPHLVFRFGTVSPTAASVRRLPDDVLSADGGEHVNTSHE